jgi:FAD/FMN-containing dehydrogenase
MLFEQTAACACLHRRKLDLLYEVDVMSSLDELAGILGEGLITDREVIDGYRRDRTAWAVPGEPLALVRPASTAEVQAVARWSTRHRVPLAAGSRGARLPVTVR